MLQRGVWGGITAVSPTAGAVLAMGDRAFREDGVLTYGAAGGKHEVSILSNAKDIADGKTGDGMSPGLMGRINNSVNVLQKVALHDPDYVIAGIEQQKADDQYVLERMTR